MKKNILISGANRGIGKELLFEVLEEGHFGVGLVKSEHTKKNLVNELGEKGYSSFEIYVCDITSDEGLYFLGQNLPKVLSKIDVLVNNAAIGTGGGLLKDVDFSEVKSFFDVNFFGAWRLYQTVDSFLKEGSRIVNISSNLGLKKELAHGGLPAYRLSKWALNGFSIQLSGELSERKVDVVAVCPGWTQTDMGGQDAPNSIGKSAAAIKWLCLTEKVESGRFYEGRKVVE